MKQKMGVIVLQGEQYRGQALFFFFFKINQQGRVSGYSEYSEFGGGGGGIFSDFFWLLLLWGAETLQVPYLFSKETLSSGGLCQMFLLQPPPTWPAILTWDAQHCRRCGNCLSLVAKQHDDHVHLNRKLLVTMMEIRIAMMTTMFVGRHIETD